MGVLAALAVVLLTATAWGATGAPTVIGKVVSNETGEPLPYANVVLYRLESMTDTVGTAAGGAITMTDGTYRISAPDGIYRLKISFVDRKSTASEAFEVKADAPPVSLDFALASSAIEIEGAEVTAVPIRDTELAILVKQKKAAAVSDGVSSEQIAKTSDSNAAEVLQRVTGLSVVGGRYVFVRGLGERYSATQINGATIGTPEPNKRVVPLDLFASGLLDNVVVQKTYTPDQPGEFGGGVVNVTTRDFPGHRIADFSFSGGYNGQTTGSTFYTYDGGKTDFLGFDDGTRELPKVVADIAKHTKVSPKSFLTHQGMSADTLALLGRAFTKTWDRQTSKGINSRAIPATGLSGTYGNELTVFGRQLGLLGSVSYSRNLETNSGVDNFYKSDQGMLEAETSYHTTVSSRDVLWGALGDASYRINDFNTVKLRTMYNRSAEDEVRYYSGDNRDWSVPVQNTRLDYVERGLFAGSISSNTFLAPLGGATLDLRFNYSRADRDEPDRREYTYEQDFSGTEPVWHLTTRSTDFGLTRMFGTMQEEERAPEATLTFPFKQWSGLESKLKAGFSYRNKDRDSQWRRFAFKQPSFSNSDLDSLTQVTPEKYMTDILIAGDPREGFVLTELTKQDTDNYRGHQDVTAEYLMADLPLTASLRAIVGARVERAKLRVDAYDIFGQLPDSTLSHAKLDNTDVLPSVNLVWNASAQTNLRFAYSSTVSRPDFRELTNQNMYDFVGGYPEVGNPKLRRARIHNWDLRLETYPGTNELGAISGFYKRLIDPIERSIQGGSVATYMPINARRGYLAGVEAEGRLSLGRIKPSWSAFGVTGNYTRVNSETDVSGYGVETTKKRPLQGQSSYVLNAGLFYAMPSGNTSASLLYNVFGRRLASVGVYGLPDIFEQPRNSLDMTATQNLGRAKLKLAVENLLDDDVTFKQKQKAIPGVVGASEKTTHTRHRGRGISLSISRSL